MSDFAEVLFHWQKGQNKTQIATSLGISRPTVRKYLKAAQKAGLNQDSDAATLAHVRGEGWQITVALDISPDPLSPL